MQNNNDSGINVNGNDYNDTNVNDNGNGDGSDDNNDNYFDGVEELSITITLFVIIEPCVDWYNINVFIDSADLGLT